MVAGVFIYDFFMGHELNPRIGPVDLKFFCELRPGLIGWVMLDLCFLAEAYETSGRIPGGLLLIVGFHTLYVADALWFEVRTLKITSSHIAGVCRRCKENDIRTACRYMHTGILFFISSLQFSQPWTLFTTVLDSC